MLSIPDHVSIMGYIDEAWFKNRHSNKETVTGIFYINSTPGNTKGNNNLILNYKHAYLIETARTYKSICIICELFQIFY
jgi:hypothetical protein